MDKIEPIESFTGQYSFLSNFYECEIDGQETTVEHLYQAAKTENEEEQKRILEATTPGKAKRLGRRASLRPDWEDIKIDVMFGLLMKKFEQSSLQTKLLATGTRKLVEGNDWGDKFWGVCRGHGENWLGRLLETVREVYETPYVGH